MKFEYYGEEDSDIIEEDLIGNPRFDLAIISMIFSVISFALIISKLSGFLSAITGMMGMVLALRALKFNRRSTLAKISFVMGFFGMIIGTLLFVSCISCTACTIRNVF